MPMPATKVVGSDVIRPISAAPRARTRKLAPEPPSTKTDALGASRMADTPEISPPMSQTSVDIRRTEIPARRAVSGSGRGPDGLAVRGEAQEGGQGDHHDRTDDHDQDVRGVHYQRPDVELEVERYGKAAEHDLGLGRVDGRDEPGHQQQLGQEDAGHHQHQAG